MPLPPLDPALLARLPDDLDGAIAVLREAGLSKVGTAGALVRYRGLSLAEAKQQVHLSPAWADQRAADDALHDALAATVEPGGSS